MSTPVLSDVVVIEGEYGLVRLDPGERRIRCRSPAQFRHRHEHLEVQRSLGDERAVEIKNRDPFCGWDVALKGRVGNTLDKREDALLDGPLRPCTQSRKIRSVPARADKRSRQYYEGRGATQFVSSKQCVSRQCEPNIEFSRY